MKGLLREAPAVRFAWIAAEKAEFTVAECCHARRVSPSGVYAWQQRPESARASRDRQLRVQVRASHAASRGRYGRPRIWKDLHDAGERVSEKRVGRLMREDGLRARARKRFRSTTMSEHDQPIAANVLDRHLYSRFIVGWALSAVNDRHLTLRALEMAMKRRCPDPGLLHHSDQGCTYASEDYRASASKATPMRRRRG